ncbi:MAG: carboxypeptidase regulatory-like domain-containing protein, partial [Candidatus Micrarchaeota archaeon]
MADEGGEGFFDKVSNAWASFLDWSDEKGLPLKRFSEWLEEKGIPSLPAFLILLIAIGALLYLFVLAPTQAVKTSSVLVSVLSADGAALNGVSVILEGNGYSSSTITTAGEGASFSNVPVGTLIAKVNSQQYVFDKTQAPVVVEEGQRATASFRTVSTGANKVFLNVRVDGAVPSTIKILDSTGKVLEFKDGTDFATFSVNTLQTYSVRAEAEGYSPGQEEVVVGSSDTYKTIYLNKIGEKTTETLTVKVVDESGALGNPIKNAVVTIADAAGLVLFTLTTAEDGTCQQEKLEVGANITITASADGFAVKTLETVFSRESKDFKIRLERATTTNAEESMVRVVDNYGNQVRSPVVRLYYLKKSGQFVFVSEQTPGDGIAKFALDGAKSYFATAFKSGYLPGFADKLEKGKTTVIELQPVTEENAGSVRVHVTDKMGADVSEAGVELLDKKSLPLGIPPRITGIDGTQLFDGVPLVEVKALAAKAGRSAESILRTVTLEGDAAENATLLTVQFPPEQGKVQVSVKDYYSNAAVSGANVIVTGGSSASCTTNSSGTCEVSVLESASATCRVTSTSYEDFESAVFLVLPNVVNKIAFSLQPRGIEANIKLQFVGVFDLDGNKVNSLSPFETYNARYILTAPSGLNFSKAKAHVRVGSQDSPIDGEPAVIVAYDASGATISKGVDYSAASSFTPTASSSSTQAQIIVSDKGFSPQSIDIDEGATVTWKFEGNMTHAVLSDDGGFGSNALKAGASYSRSFP